MSRTIRVIAHIKALPDHVSEVQQILMTLIEPTRKEPGCIQYQLYQNLADKTDFTFVEEWENNSFIDVHLQSAHLAKVITQISGLLATSADIRRYNLLA